MAWNPDPKVADCREVARKWRMTQTIVLGFDQAKGTFAIASYGETAEMCANARKINERIAAMIARGELSLDD